MRLNGDATDTPLTPSSFIACCTRKIVCFQVYLPTPPTPSFHRAVLSSYTITASLSTKESVSLWRYWLRDLLSAIMAASSFLIRFLRFLLKFTWKEEHKYEHFRICEKHDKCCIQIIILVKYNAPSLKCSLPDVLKLHVALPRRVRCPMNILH